ncbi:MAG: hypothetical protein M3N41_03390 [Acidobacteriota bacterium]|nr:hypothetical protein [Acidobacteriota bacterium]
MKMINFLQLSKPRRDLIRLCQWVNYGSILNLQVTDGDVSCDIPPEVVLDIKLDADFKQRPELDLDDFALSLETCRLLGQIDSLKNGVIEKIVVHDGIPRRLVFRVPLPEVRR